MKFGRRFENSKIPEWADFYVSYRILKKLLSPYKVLAQFYLRSRIDNNTITVHNFTYDDIQKLEYFGKIFEKLIFQDLEKILAFYTIKLNHVVVKWRKLRINLIIYKQRKELLPIETQNEHLSMLKESFQALIKETKLLNDYMSVNLEAFTKILKKQKKAVTLFSTKSDLKTRFEKYLTETKTHKTRDRLNNFLFSVENEYIDFFHKNRSEGMKELRKIFQGNLISRNETFWFGLFLGFTALLILVICVLIWDEELSIDEDEIFKKVFPIFRGIGLIIVYVWLIAWNVYVWTSYHVNYKLIFRFNYHYSQLSEILTRASAFSAVLLILLLWYLILAGNSGKLNYAFGIVPKEVIPLFVWLFFIGYIFFPSRKLFNGQGRFYVFKLLRNIVKTPFISLNFPIIWSTDQLASFVLPLKDLQYTFCFYITYFFDDPNNVSECQQGVIKGVILAAVPLIWRYLQCLRQCYDAGEILKDPIVNSFKYLFSFFVAILSYMASRNQTNPVIFQVWILVAAISTLYSYLWDLKKDWGFLTPNARYKFLRNDLSYNQPAIYYFAMVLNFVMRLAWVCSISPDLIAKNIRPELFALIIGFVEIFRRAVWNFLRVEKEHIANVGNFKAVPDMNLPFGDIIYDQGIREEDVFMHELKVMIESDNKLGKPISGAEAQNKASITRRGSLHFTESNDPNMSFKFIPEGDEYTKLKQLSKMTLEPLKTLKNRDLHEFDLRKYRDVSAYFDQYEKEIKKFKQYVVERANQFQVVPNYKELKFLRKDTKPFESHFEPELNSSKIMKGAISRTNLYALNNAQVPEEDPSKSQSSIDFITPSMGRLSHDENDNFHSNLHAPLLVEMKKMSMDGKLAK